jgi:hypothetical protein
MPEFLAETYARVRLVGLRPARIAPAADSRA